MSLNIQPTLQNQLVRIRPLTTNDFENLFAVANDKLLWEQHPNPNRYKREVFEVFFRGAIESKGAFLVSDVLTGNTIGTSRYYDYKPEEKLVTIGYTFIARSHWRRSYNKALKVLMLNHAFEKVEQVLFHIGAVNIRSQKAIEKLGAVKINEIEMEYYGETSKLNFVYAINKFDWNQNLINTLPG